MIVDVALEQGSDNPQLIFESMNSTGLDLTQANLIRNFVLIGLEPKAQLKLFRTTGSRWRRASRRGNRRISTASFAIS